MPDGFDYGALTADEAQRMVTRALGQIHDDGMRRFDARLHKALAGEPMTTLSTPSGLSMQLRRALAATAIGEILATLVQHEVGLLPEDHERLRNIPLMRREQLMSVAERCVKDAMDYERRVELADNAVAATVEWTEGPYDGQIPTTADVARKAIAMFCEGERA